MIVYRCDRCGSETTPEKHYEVEVLFTPRTPNGNEDTDQEYRSWLGHLCKDCTEMIEPLLQALVQPETADAVREAPDSPIVPLRDNDSSSSS